MIHQNMPRNRRGRFEAFWPCPIFGWSSHLRGPQGLPTHVSITGETRSISRLGIADHWQLLWQLAIETWSRQPNHAWAFASWFEDCLGLARSSLRRREALIVIRSAVHLPVALVIFRESTTAAGAATDWGLNLGGVSGATCRSSLRLRANSSSRSFLGSWWPYWRFNVALLMAFAMSNPAPSNFTPSKNSAATYSPGYSDARLCSSTIEPNIYSTII